MIDIDWATVKAVTIPEGSVKKVECNGVTLWETPSTEDSYLEFDNTFYLRSNYIPTANTRVVVDFSCNNNQTTSLTLFGTRDSATSNAFYFWARVAANKTIRYQHNAAPSGASYGTYNNVMLSEDYRYILDTDAQAITQDGNTVVQMDVNPDYIGSTYPFYVGAIRNGSTTHPLSGRVFIGKIYSFKIYEGSTLAANYLPDGDTLTDTISGTSMTVAAKP